MPRNCISIPDQSRSAFRPLQVVAIQGSCSTFTVMAKVCRHRCDFVQPLTSPSQSAPRLRAKRISTPRYLHPLPPFHDGDISLMNLKCHQLFARNALLSEPGFPLPRSTRSAGQERVPPTGGMPLKIARKTLSQGRKSGILPLNFCFITSPSRENLHWSNLSLDSMFLRRYPL